MTAKEENYLTMMIIVRNFHNTHLSTVSSLPKYLENSLILLDCIPKIQDLSEIQKAGKGGIVELKNSLREKIIVTVLDYSGKLTSFAKFTNNLVLAKEVKMSRSKLDRSTDLSLRDYAQLMYDRAETNIDALDTYEIDNSRQTIFNTDIKAYNDILGKPGMARIDSGDTTKQIKALIKMALAALENMDASIKIIEFTNPEFYASYHTARKIIKTGTRSIAIRGLITEATSGLPLMNASISFIPTTDGTKASAENTKPLIVKKSAKKGGFNIKSLPEGTYTVIIKKIGYVDHVTTITIAAGERSELKVELAKK